MEAFFLYMYPLVSVISVIGYFPQIVKILKSVEPPQSVSIMSWYVWTLSAVLTFGYAMFHLDDLMFSLTAGVNLTLVSLTTGILLFRLHGAVLRRAPAR